VRTYIIVTTVTTILRGNYGPARNPDNGEYERRKNADIESLFNGPNIQNVLISKRIEWAGHVSWRAKHDLINNVLINKPSGKRPRGRPRQRWMDRVKNDLMRVDETAVIEDADDGNRRRDLTEAAERHRNNGNYVFRM